MTPLLNNRAVLTATGLFIVTTAILFCSLNKNRLFCFASSLLLIFGHKITRWDGETRCRRVNPGGFKEQGAEKRELGVLKMHYETTQSPSQREHRGPVCFNQLTLNLHQQQARTKPL